MLNFLDKIDIKLFKASALYDFFLVIFITVKPGLAVTSIKHPTAGCRRSIFYESKMFVLIVN